MISKYSFTLKRAVTIADELLQNKVYARRFYDIREGKGLFRAASAVAQRLGFCSLVRNVAPFCSFYYEQKALTRISMGIYAIVNPMFDVSIGLTMI